MLGGRRGSEGERRWDASGRMRRSATLDDLERNALNQFKPSESTASDESYVRVQPGANRTGQQRTNGEKRVPSPDEQSLLLTSSPYPLPSQSLVHTLSHPHKPLGARQSLCIYHLAYSYNSSSHPSSCCTPPLESLRVGPERQPSPVRYLVHRLAVPRVRTREDGVLVFRMEL